MVSETDWDNSDTSSDEDEDFSSLGLAPTDPLQREEDSGDSDDEPHRIQSMLALSLCKRLNYHVVIVAQLPLPPSQCPMTSQDMTTSTRCNQ